MKVSCSHCKKEFRDLRHLQKHTHSVHSGRVQCTECEKTFSRRDNMLTHQKKEHDSGTGNQLATKSKPLVPYSDSEDEVQVVEQPATSAKPTKVHRCPTCHQKFTERRSLNQHEREQHQNPDRYKCEKCDKSFKRQSHLKSHTQHVHLNPRKRKSGVEITMKAVAKKARKDPLPEDPIDPPEELDLIDETDGIYRKDWSQIRTHHHKTKKIQDTHNFRLEGMDLEEMKADLEKIFKTQQWQGKWNLSFGFILRNTITDELVYYYSSNNTKFLDKPHFIGNQGDLDQLLSKLDKSDPLEWAKQMRPNTKFVVERLTNMTVYVHKLIKHPIGAPVRLPQYIRDNKAIKALTTNGHGVSYDDNLCFFRCFASSQCDSRRMERLAQICYRHWCQHTMFDDDEEGFPGVTLDDMEKLEECFNVNIQVYELDKDGEVDDGGRTVQQMVAEAIANEPVFFPALILEESDGEDEDEEGVVEERRLPRNPFIDDMAEDDGSDGESLLAEEPMDVTEQASPVEHPHEPVAEPDDVAEVVEEPYATLVRRSEGKYGRTMYLNLYENHFSLITDIEQYAKSWKCTGCNKLFNHRNDHRRHADVCNGGVPELRYPGGGFGLPKTIHEELQEEGYDVPGRFYPYRATFDYEAMFNTIDRKSPSGKLHFINSLEPVSVSVASNVPGYEEPKCFISNGEASEIVQQMFEHLRLISDKAKEELMREYSDILHDLQAKSDQHKDFKRQLTNLRRQGVQGEEVDKLRGQVAESKKWMVLHGKLNRWISQLPVLGFNSAKFDMNLIKKHLIPYLVRNGVKVYYTVKRNNSYMSLSTETLLFLDITNYLAAGTSYDKWLKSFQVEQRKGVWPYEWLTSLERLDEQELPPKDAFFSTLKRKAITDEEYAEAQRTWQAKGFTTMRDMLVWYNNLDVEPFLTAAEKMFTHFRELDIDMFKEAISLPGVAMKHMFKTKPESAVFTLWNKKNAHWQHLVRDNIVGGPSIVFHRKHEAGVARIGGNLVKKIVGYDANGLYLWSLCEEMPVGIYGVWEPCEENNYGKPVTTNAPSENGARLSEMKKWESDVAANMAKTFKQEMGYTYCERELQFLDWKREDLEQEYFVKTKERKVLHVQHRFNGGQKVFYNGSARYPVDGYIADCKPLYDKPVVLQFHGCYFHGHDCSWTNNMTAEEKEQKAEETRRIEEFLKTQNVELISMYECDFKKAIRGTHWYEGRKLTFGGKDKNKHWTAGDLVTGVEDGTFFGIIECDIQVPWFDVEARERFKELPPIFKNIEITKDDIGPVMRAYADQHGLMKQSRRALISSYHAERQLIATPLLQWYVINGLRITRIYQAVQFQKSPVFKHLKDEVSNHRRAADTDPNQKTTGELWKLLGNSMYGKCVTDLEKHQDVVFAIMAEASKLTNTPRFRDKKEVDDDIYEVLMAKSKIVFNLPNLIAFFVYSYAKLNMLQFYAFLHTCIGPSNFQLIQMDTDSLYFALVHDTLEESVLPEKQQFFEDNKHDFLALTDYDQRTPGLFKMEWEGDGMIALCSKTYYGWKNNEAGAMESEKCSTKGLSKTTNKVTRQMFLECLEEQIRHGGTNHSFMIKNSEVLQYKQRRDSLSYFYPKRIVLEDNISTAPLYI